MLINFVSCLTEWLIMSISLELLLSLLSSLISNYLLWLVIIAFLRKDEVLVFIIDLDLISSSCLSSPSSMASEGRPNLLTLYSSFPFL